MALRFGWRRCCALKPDLAVRSLELAHPVFSFEVFLGSAAESLKINELNERPRGLNRLHIRSGNQAVNWTLVQYGKCNRASWPEIVKAWT
jgi:hypothetical protein